MPLGIPHSVFLSWNQLDQDKALAYIRAKDQVCDVCGSREADWIDPETGRLLPEPPLTPIGLKCHGCAEVEAYRKSALEGEHKPGVRVVLVPDDMVDLEGKLKRNP